MTATMKALRKLTYRGQQLAVGDTFKAKPKDAALFKLAKLAEEVNDAPEYQTRALKAEKGTPVKAQTSDDGAQRKPAVAEDGTEDVAALRAEYQRVVGRKPFNAWKPETLRNKIATYKRRDMRAVD